MAAKMKNMAYWKAKHNLPGININSEGDTDLPDGRSGSSPFQQNEERHSTGVSNKQHRKIKKTSAAYKKTLRKGSGATQEEKARAGRAAMNAMF